MDAFDREEEYLEQALASGDISQAEYNKLMRELQRDYRAEAQEAAWDAHDRELSNW